MDAALPLNALVVETAEGLAALRQSLDLSARRLQGDPKASNLLLTARNEGRFGPLRQSPEFQKLVSAQ